MLEEWCPYAEGYRHMRDVAQDLGAEELLLGFRASSEQDPRRYNPPTGTPAESTAVLFVSRDGAHQSNRDIVIWPHAHKMHRVAEYSEHIDPLAYPLLFSIR